MANGSSISIRPKQVFILCLNTSRTWLHCPEWRPHRIHPTYKGGLLSVWESTRDHVLQPKWRWRTVWSLVSLSNGDHFADRYPRHKMLPRLQGVISHVYVWQKAPFPNSSASYTFSASVKFSFFSGPADAKARSTCIRMLHQVAAYRLSWTLRVCTSKYQLWLCWFLSRVYIWKALSFSASDIFLHLLFFLKPLLFLLRTHWCRGSLHMHDT